MYPYRTSGTRTGMTQFPCTTQTIAERAADLARQSRAAATRKAYRNDWQHFTAWCDQLNLTTLPCLPSTVGMYLAAHAETLAVSTLERRLSSIAVAHRTAGHAFDTRAEAI